jgi:hypothetical protein
VTPRGLQSPHCPVDCAAWRGVKETSTRRAPLIKAGPKQYPPFGPVTVAKAYRLLGAILSTAVTDKRIRENPCQIKGADKESSPERPVLSVPRCTGWPTRSRRGTAPWCSLPPSATCAGVNWPDCGAGTWI